MGRRERREKNKKKKIKDKKRRGGEGGGGEGKQKTPRGLNKSKWYLQVGVCVQGVLNGYNQFVGRVGDAMPIQTVLFLTRLTAFLSLS